MVWIVEHILIILFEDGVPFYFPLVGKLHFLESIPKGSIPTVSRSNSDLDPIHFCRDVHDYK